MVRVYPWFRMTPPAHMSRAIERVGVYLWNQYIVKLEFGLLPKEYNFKKHGPYSHELRKKSSGLRSLMEEDTKFLDLKVSELPAWIGRRDKSVPNTARAVSRAYHNWEHNFKNVKYQNLVFVLQFVFGFTTLFYIMRFDQHEKERRARYHW